MFRRIRKMDAKGEKAVFRSSKHVLSFVLEQNRTDGAAVRGRNEPVSVLPGEHPQKLICLFELEGCELRKI